MSGTEGEPEYRTGSADSENSSDSFVQVNKEDAPPQPEQLMEPEESEPVAAESEQGSGIPASDDIQDMYGGGETAPEDKEVRCVDNFIRKTSERFSPCTVQIIL